MLVRIAVIKIRILVLDMNCDGELDIVAVCKSGYLKNRDFTDTLCFISTIRTCKEELSIFSYLL